MAFTKETCKKVAKDNPCEICGWNFMGRDAAHIIDASDYKEEEVWNVISLCPNCHRLFDEKLRPKLFKALTNFGAKNLPPSWKDNNKHSSRVGRIFEDAA